MFAKPDEMSGFIFYSWVNVHIAESAILKNEA